LVDLNHLIDRALGIVRPRIDRLGVEVTPHLDRTMGPVRVVPLDIEQILLNLLNNALDSLSSKRQKSERARLELRIGTKLNRLPGEEWAEVDVWDSGMGIGKQDLKNVTKPFFTTKRPGEGTGLGLTICQQLAGKYGGVLNIDSKEGAWAEVKLRIPYRTNA
jgi:C4-dicarboxylate-specific signal transduction histidine kinase